MVESRTTGCWPACMNGCISTQGIYPAWNLTDVESGCDTLDPILCQLPRLPRSQVFINTSIDNYALKFFQMRLRPRSYYAQFPKKFAEFTKKFSGMSVR